MFNWKGFLSIPGSTCIVIDRATWETLKEKKVRCVSRKSNRKLYSYGSNEPLTTAGEFETELCYKGKCCHVCFIVVEEKARAILSRETSEELAILKLEINIYLFIYQLFWTQACLEGMGTNGTQVPCEVPSLPNPTTCKGWPHHQGLEPLLFSNSDVGSFMSHKNKSVKVL